MGYTTDFQGSFTVTPALPSNLVNKIQKFCDERHEDENGHWPYS